MHQSPAGVVNLRRRDRELMNGNFQPPPPSEISPQIFIQPLFIIYLLAATANVQEIHLLENYKLSFSKYLPEFPQDHAINPIANPTNPTTQAAIPPVESIVASEVEFDDPELELPDAAALELELELGG